MARLDVTDRLHRIRASTPIEGGAPRPLDIAAHRRPVVMYVDDNPTVRELVIAMLGEDPRFDLIVAENGSEGLALAQLHRPALVLLDVQMPGLNGYEVCSALRASPKTKNARVVMVTALGEREDVDRGFAAGADDYFPKPFRYADLMGSIDGFVGALAQSHVA